MQPGKQNDRFTPETRNVIAIAKRSVMEYRHTHITPEHILVGILTESSPMVEAIFKASNATPDQIRELVKHHQRPGDEEAIPEHLVTFSERAKRVIEAARTEAQRARAPQIAPEHLLLGLTMVPNTVCGAVLRAVELTTDKVREALAGN